MRILTSSPFCRPCSSPVRLSEPRCSKLRRGRNAAGPRETRAQLAARGESPFRLAINFLGGFDDSIAALGGGVAGPASSSASCYQGFSDVTFGYTLRRPDRELNTSVEGFVATNRNLDLGPSYGSRGGRARAHGARPSKRTGGGGRPPVPTGTCPSARGAGAAVVPSRAFRLRIRPIRFCSAAPWSTQTAATINRRWTRETTTAFSYALFQTDVSRQQWVRRRHAYGKRESFPVPSEWARAFAAVFSARPAGTRMQWLCIANSRLATDRRRVELCAGPVADAPDFPVRRWRHVVRRHGECDHPRALRVLDPHGLRRDERWHPAGRGVAAASYRRAPTMLHGVTAESFLSESASISVGGLFSRRASGRVYGRVYRRRDKPDPGLSSERAVRRLHGHGAAAVRAHALVVGVANYTRYRHQRTRPPALALGVTPNFDRNAVRAGSAGRFRSRAAPDEGVTR